MKNLFKNFENIKEYVYYFNVNGILFCCDNEIILKEIKENSVDLIFTDPPYNIAEKNKLTKRKGEIITNTEAWGNDFKDNWLNFDDYINFILNYFQIFEKIIKNTGNIVVFLDRKYTGLFAYLVEKNTKLIFKNKIYFLKKNPLPNARKNNYRSQIEETIWFVKSTKFTFNFLEQSEMKQVFEGVLGRKETDHPTEKYKWMVEPIIKHHSKENDVVLDIFAGSGSMLIESEKLNRKWIGIEKEKKYCEMIKQRFEKYYKSEKKQLKIF